jgi:hypothetical protein
MIFKIVLTVVTFCTTLFAQQDSLEIDSSKHETDSALSSISLTEYYKKNPLCGSYNFDTKTIQYMTNLHLGTHRQSIGAGGNFLKYIHWIPAKILSKAERLSLTLTGGMGYTYNHSYFGIPGQSHTFEGDLGFYLSLGKENNLYKKYFNINEPGRHNFRLYQSAFLTTDGTSQLIGGLYYSFIFKNSVLGFEYNNDTFTLYPSDEYRTAAVTSFYYRDKGNYLIGCNLGFKLWTGERKFTFLVDGEFVWPEEVNRDSVATLYYGNEYSHGVLFASFVINEFTISIGWDSEKVRDLFQNSVHFILNDAEVPLLERADRFYIEFKMFGFSSLY